MRKIIIKISDTVTKEISSPWLNITESYLYLGISYKDFKKNAAHLPYRNIGKGRQYHTDDLDKIKPLITGNSVSQENKEAQHEGNIVKDGSVKNATEGIPGC